MAGGHSNKRNTFKKILKFVKNNEGLWNLN